MTARKAGMLSRTTSVLSAQAARLTVHAQARTAPLCAMRNRADRCCLTPLPARCTPGKTATGAGLPAYLLRQTACSTLRNPATIPNLHLASCRLMSLTQHTLNLCTYVLCNLP